MVDYKKMLSEVEGELKSLDIAEADAEALLAEVREKKVAMIATYNAIAPLVGKAALPALQDSMMLPPKISDGLKAAGISVVVRAILDATPETDFTTSAVRDRLAEMEWDLGKYKQPLATIQTVLHRLVESRFAQQTATAEGTKAFYSSRRDVATPPHRIASSMTA
jgi:hypothetical protein